MDHGIADDWASYNVWWACCISVGGRYPAHAYNVDYIGAYARLR